MSDLQDFLEGYDSSSSSNSDGEVPQQNKTSQQQIQVQNDKEIQNNYSAINQGGNIIKNNLNPVNGNLNKLTTNSNQGNKQVQEISDAKKVLGKRPLLSILPNKDSNKQRMGLGFSKIQKSNSDDDNEDEVEDLMSRARINITKKNQQDTIIKQRQQQEDGLKCKDQLDKEERERIEKHKQKLQNINPQAQKLFEMLPPPKYSIDASISSALRSNVDISYIPLEKEDDDYLSRPKPKSGLPGALLNDDKYIDINGNDMLNKEEFYRNHLKKHSINAFKDQTMQRMKGTYDQINSLAQKGKGKNHLASLASDHMDFITKFEGDKNQNLDEFRQKRARYGW
eukprot:403335878